MFADVQTSKTMGLGLLGNVDRTEVGLGREGMQQGDDA